MTDGWEPTTADLRDPSEVAETAHAGRALEQIREGVSDNVLDIKDYRAAVDEVVSGRDAGESS